MLAQLRKYLDAEGRDPSSFPIGKRAYVAIDRPAEEVAEWFRAVYGPVISREVAIAGSVDEVVRALPSSGRLARGSCWSARSETTGRNSSL
jgi:hypothetical protein